MSDKDLLPVDVAIGICQHAACSFYCGFHRQRPVNSCVMCAIAKLDRDEKLLILDKLLREFPGHKP